MRIALLLVYYFWWHYTAGVIDLTRNYTSIVVFLNNFFSLKHLVIHLFSPWKRLGEAYPEKFNWADFFSALITNTLMRLVGCVVRVVFLLIGVVALGLSAIGFVLALIFWLALPVAVIILFALSLKLLMATV